MEWGLLLVLLVVAAFLAVVVMAPQPATQTMLFAVWVVLAVASFWPLVSWLFRQGLVLLRL